MTTTSDKPGVRLRIVRFLPRCIPYFVAGCLVTVVLTWLDAWQEQSWSSTMFRSTAAANPNDDTPGRWIVFQGDRDRHAYGCVHPPVDPEEVSYRSASESGRGNRARRTQVPGWAVPVDQASTGTRIMRVTEAYGSPFRSGICVYDVHYNNGTPIAIDVVSGQVPPSATLFADQFVPRPRALPVRILWVGFLVNALNYGAWLLAVRWLLWYIRVDYRKFRRRCPKCGHTRGTWTTCPECGKAVKPADW
ncbi:MAG: hypothetical protein AAF432_10815 [Planctomycetota bacterium]